MAGPTTLARPYARAAFTLAHERGALDAWEKALQESAAIAADPAARAVIDHPAAETPRLVALLMPRAGAPEDFEGFLHELGRNDRFALLPYIHAQYSVLKDDAEQTVTVEVAAAVDVDDAWRQRLERALAKRFARNIELTVRHDPELLGGAVIRAGDLVIDGSVRGKLSRMSAAIAS